MIWKSMSTTAYLPTAMGSDYCSDVGELFQRKRLKKRYTI